MRRKLKVLTLSVLFIMLSGVIFSTQMISVKSGRLIGDNTEKGKVNYHEIDGSEYHSEKPKENHTGWQKIDRSWYYLGDGGAMQVGWYKINNKWYYMNSSGVMQTGWCKINNKWYHMNSSGVMQTGWHKINNKWYYMNSSGVMQTGWCKINNKWYHMNSSGVMHIGEININGIWYYMNPQGALQAENRKVIPTVKSGIMIVNKKHPLPASYNPGENSQAVNQLKKMIKAMQNQGFDISNSYSGFRTYAYQKKLYEGYVQKDGQKAADTYSARPGYSEHQTGLAYDLKHRDGTLVIKTSEVRWIARNAANYGFIVRYQAGKEKITGYQAEPWHLRYAGEQATPIYKSGLTLEEYLGVPGGDYYHN